jgi:HTH-type transcriptional regulator/antitoxin HigA
MKLIKTATDHAAALEALEALMIANPPAGSEDSEKIELLGFLIENYEQKQHPIAPPETDDSTARVTQSTIWNT